MLFVALLAMAAATALSQGGYFPPPSSVAYDNGILTVYPPDSLPGPPVALLSYNIGIDGVFYTNIPVVNPADTLHHPLDFQMVYPGSQEFCVSAVYNQWISEETCMTALVIYGYDPPLFEDWTSGTFSQNNWAPLSSRWVIHSGQGNPAPEVRFNGAPALLEYSETLQSYAIRADSFGECSRVFIEYDLKLSSVNPTGNEKLTVKVWKWETKTWSPIRIYTNQDGSFGWKHEKISINNSRQQILKFRFEVTGANSADIEAWSVDNVHIYRYCNGPIGLTLYEDWTYNELYYDLPTGCPQALYFSWTNLGFYTSIGTGQAAEFDVAARWMPGMLAPFDGMLLRDIAFVPGESLAEYHVRVWTDSNAANLILDQLVTDPVINEWNYVCPDTAIFLDASKEFWVGYHITTPAGYPAGCDDGPVVDNFGNLIFWEGEWTTLLNLNSSLPYNWSIVFFLGQSFTTSYVNVYRETNGGGFELIDVTTDYPYTDNNINLADYYCYKLTRVYIDGSDTCESDPSNIACETLMLSLDDNGTDTHARIYPNPAVDEIKIESDRLIGEIVLFGYLGEIVAVYGVNNRQYTLNTSRLSPGVYLLKLIFEERVEYLKFIKSP